VHGPDRYSQAPQDGRLVQRILGCRAKVNCCIRDLLTDSVSINKHKELIVFQGFLKQYTTQGKCRLIHKPLTKSRSRIGDFIVK
jgi:hypothetical protein